MAIAINQSTKDSFLKVIFSYDIQTNNFQEKYTDLPTALSGGFQATPAMKVTIPKNTGSLEKKELTIDIPQDTFTLRITNGRPHAPIFVVVQEVIVPTNPADQTTLLTLFRGRVMRAKRNPAGIAGSVRILAQRPKTRLKIPTGLPVMHHCPFDTYGAGSQLNRVDFRRVLRMDLIVGNIVTMNTDPGDPDGEFKNGYMGFEGLTIKIREWDNDVVYTLIEEPPASWLNNFINVYSGSNKTIEDVRDKLSNEEHFGGIGFKIPPYNPQFEDTASG